VATGEWETIMALVYFGADGNGNEYVIDDARVIHASFIMETTENGQTIPPKIELVLDAGNGVHERITIQGPRVRITWTAWHEHLKALKVPDSSGFPT